ncbi:putative Mitogen-activated protein kinase 5 [Blattamonas nauphoetae]|uniref:Mitogen-activated protein kinase 5 n=1 Tax=Blattamonas nauphoetae TaxID=2049346 RepID=A0ABQ9XNR8_9EUKA|nr:putative Mitogen-activated protein kinase 5 [Blattamonas nauphoetae]
MTQCCPNCHQDIAANFERHVTYCTRFIILCPKCGEPVQKTALDEHYAESHQSVECELCHMQIDQYFLELHQKDECQCRILGQCPYCEIDLFPHTDPNHIEECGNRTDLCDVCHQRVLVKFLMLHLHSGCAEHVLEPPAPRQRTPEESLDNMRAAALGDFFGSTPSGNIYTSNPTVKTNSEHTTAPTRNSREPSFKFICPLCHQYESQSEDECTHHIQSNCPMNEFIAEYFEANGFPPMPLRVEKAKPAAQRAIPLQPRPTHQPPAHSAPRVSKPKPKPSPVYSDLASDKRAERFAKKTAPKSRIKSLVSSSSTPPPSKAFKSALTTVGTSDKGHVLQPDYTPPPQKPKPTKQTKKSENKTAASAEPTSKKTQSERYTPLKIIGKGSYGVVLSVHDSVTGENRAVKKASKAFQSRTDAKRTLREIRLLKRLIHPNIVSLQDIILSAPSNSPNPASSPTDSSNTPLPFPSPKPQSLPSVLSKHANHSNTESSSPDSLFDVFTDVYFVLDLMDSDLHHVLKSNHKLSDDQICYLTYQMLLGVAFMHEQGIMHRDLKPGNILVNKDCTVKITDFGLARPVLPNQDLGSKMLTEYVATRWYRAPEIVLGSSNYGVESDMWSVGCLFAEFFTRSPLFPGRDYLHQLHLIVERLGVPDDKTLTQYDNDKAIRYLKSLATTLSPQESHEFPVCTPPNATPELLEVMSSPIFLAWHDHFVEKNVSFPATPLSLLVKLLAWDPRERLSAKEALLHPYFDGMREADEELMNTDLNWADTPPITPMSTMSTASPIPIRRSSLSTPINTPLSHSRSPRISPIHHKVLAPFSLDYEPFIVSTSQCRHLIFAEALLFNSTNPLSTPLNKGNYTPPVEMHALLEMLNAGIWTGLFGMEAPTDRTEESKNDSALDSPRQIYSGKSKLPTRTISFNTNLSKYSADPEEPSTPVFPSDNPRSSRRLAPMPFTVPTAEEGKKNEKFEIPTKRNSIRRTATSSPSNYSQSPIPVGDAGSGVKEEKKKSLSAKSNQRGVSPRNVGQGEKGKEKEDDRKNGKTGIETPKQTPQPKHTRTTSSADLKTRVEERKEEKKVVADSLISPKRAQSMRLSPTVVSSSPGPSSAKKAVRKQK